MRKMHRFLFLLFACCCLLLAESKQTRQAGKKVRRLKPKPEPGTCPDTCALKRRIGKIEIRFAADVAEVKSVCLTEMNDLRSELGNTTFSQPTLVTDDMENIKENLSLSLERRISEAVNDLRGDFNDGQTKINEALDSVRELASSMTPITPDQEMRESRQREIDLRSTIDFMNRTLQTLQIQNVNLQRQTQAVRSQSAVLRAQNEILNDENAELRKQKQPQKLSDKAEQRLTEIEDMLSQQVSSIKSLEQQLEWLTERVDTLSDGVDGAAYEAASASEAATRAEEIANEALAAARGRPIDTSQSVGHGPTELPQPETPPGDCWELMEMGYNKSGIYRIQPWNFNQVFEVYCEQSYNGGGWTMIQKRRDGSVDFDRDWQSYADGFGDLKGEMWLGNDKIHAITNQNTNPYVLQVLLLDWDGSRAYAQYDGFRVHSNAEYYSIGYRFSHGSAGDGLRGTLEDGSRNLYLARFTTSDMDNDNCRPCMNGDAPFENCADLQGGGWWFRACSDSNLNGRYIQQTDIESCGDACYGIQWRTWRSDARYSLKASIMLIRPTAP